LQEGPLSKRQLASISNGYECKVTVFHTEDLKTPVGRKTFRLSPDSREEGLRNLGDVAVESSHGKKQTRIYLKAVIDPSPGSEEATFALVRASYRGEKTVDTESLGRTSTLSGSGKITSWIDSYKVDVECRVLGLPELANDGRGGGGLTIDPSPVPGDGRGGHPPDDGRGGRPPDDGRGGLPPEDGRGGHGSGRGRGEIS
jgi:hypothetical protein